MTDTVLDWPYLWSWCLIYRLSILPMWDHNLSLSISLSWWRTCLPDEPWGCQTPCDLLGVSLMTQYLEESEYERRRVPFYNAQRETGGKTETQRGRGEEGGWQREHKRLLLVMFMALRSPQGCGAPAFSSFWVFKQPILTALYHTDIWG